MAFITTTDLKDDLANLLKIAGGAAALQDYWDGIVADAVAAAYQDIRTALLKRGYTATQIDNWDNGETFNTDIGLYWVMVKGAGYHGYASEFIVRLDRRKELETVAVTIGGELVDPEGSSTVIGRAGYGRLDTTDDTYTRDSRW